MSLVGQGPPPGPPPAPSAAHSIADGMVHRSERTQSATRSALFLGSRNWIEPDPVQRYSLWTARCGVYGHRRANEGRRGRSNRSRPHIDSTRVQALLCIQINNMRGVRYGLE